MTNEAADRIKGLLIQDAIDGFGTPNKLMVSHADLLALVEALQALQEAVAERLASLTPPLEQDR